MKGGGIYDGSASLLRPSSHLSSNLIIATTTHHLAHARGFVAGSVGQQGASYLGQNQEFPHASYGSPSRGAGNIGRLLYDACDNPALLPQWGLKSKGACV